MEKTDVGNVIPLNIGWSDLGIGNHSGKQVKKMIMVM